MSEGLLEAAVLPLLPLRSVVLFPGVSMPVDLARPRSVEAVRVATSLAGRVGRHNMVVVAIQRNPLLEQPTFDDLHGIATLCRVVQVLRGLPGRMTVILQGVERVELEALRDVDGCDQVEYQPIAGPTSDPTLRTALAAVLRDLVKRHEALLPPSRSNQQRQEAMQEVLDAGPPGLVGDLIANLVDLEHLDRLGLLQQLDVDERLRATLELVAQRCNELEVKRDIDRSVRDHLSRHEQETVLRHKMRAIQAELGDDEPDNWFEDLSGRLDQKVLPEAAQITVDRELRRLERMNPESGEANISRTYLEWIADLPWLIPGSPPDRPLVDLDAARARLDADHYGLRKAKKRVLEYLAVRKLAPDQRGPLLCLAGPPGVGKTTLARSIAATLGRPFVRFSLGGVRDDAEIRGHRRTYVGALPGRLIQSMKTAGSPDPVILLDEIDKLSNADLRGDPASALLEALDPEQNDSFEDHYLGVPYDLSRVIFICTANEMGAIPPVLRDRLEFILLSGYTLDEKLQIARTHLLPKELRDNGLAPIFGDGDGEVPPGASASEALRAQRARNTSLLAATRREGDPPVIGVTPHIDIADDTIIRLATEYTRESGVRSLQRALAALLRDIAMQTAEAAGTSPAQIHIDPDDLGRILGPPRFREELMAPGPRIGVCTGLGWTPTGGRLLFVEVSISPGKGRLRLTGRLGDVMKESGQAAMSLIRSQAAVLGVDHVDFQAMDVHVHLPSGAIPKDGPSAGIALTTALLSALTGRPVRHDIAMTGEVTLRGHVLPIGGVREKVLAAHRAGIRDVILPSRNRKDEHDIPAAALEDLSLHFVSDVDEVLALALGEPVRASA